MKDETVTYLVKMYSDYLGTWHVIYASASRDEAKEFAKGFNDREKYQVIEKKVTLSETKIKY